MPAAPHPPPEDEHLWARILTEVQSRSASNLPQGSVLVLGSNESGKTSLIAHLQRNADQKKGAGLEYHYLEVNPDYRDGSYAYQLGSALPDVGPGESTRLGVWVLDGDPVYARLMRFALGQSADALDRSVVLLCASMAEPWLIYDALNNWAAILNDQVANSGAYDERVLRDARDRQTRFWQEYVEPLDSSSHSEMGAKVPSMDIDHVLLPLGESTLTKNLGMPIIVVITKCDAMATLEKEYDFKEEHFDFIQQHIRKFCLNYGAALVYTSVKETRNCDILHKYLLHRIYGFSFTMPARVVEKDAVFIPAGWDNEKKISILFENLNSMKHTDSYTEHIKKPVLRRPITKDAEVHAEDEQAFLARQQASFASQAAAPQAPSPTPGKRPSNVTESPLPARAKSAVAGAFPATSSTLNTGKKVVDGKALTGGVPPGAGADGSGSLAAFFNNLLKTKPGDAANGAVPNSGQVEVMSGQTPPTLNPQAELQRMLSQTSSTAENGDDEELDANRQNGNAEEATVASS
uniref:Dynein light intermediate chain n=1 Tax=Plectus sambesii TaxID=2011161 RepID=A0A914VZU8_9BILA